MDFVNKGNSSCAIFNLSEKQCDKLLLDLENALLKEKNYNNSKAYLVICNLFLTLLSLENDKETNSAVPHFINEIKEYVDKNYTTIRTVEELTKHFFYSREYISRSFRKYYNTPLYDYILERKISYCASLLLKGETVENASKNAGFNNLSSFIKIFKKYYNLTPSEYKKKK
jgi:AraC-like DNA-binding protein